MTFRGLPYRALVLVIVLLALTPSQATVSIYCVAGVSLSAEPVQSVFTKLDAVVVRVTIANNTERDISYAPDWFPFGVDLDKASAKGCWQMVVGNIPARGVPNGKALPANADYVVLKPHESHSQDVDITRLMRSVGNVKVLKSGKHCSVVSPADKASPTKDVYRVRFWDDGVRAPNVRNDPSRGTCATRRAVAIFSVEK